MSGVDIIPVDPYFIPDEIPEVENCDVSENDPLGSVVICNVKMEDDSIELSSFDNAEGPSKSRYGRKRKPKISEDFLPTDRKISTILGISLKGFISTSNSKEISKPIKKEVKKISKHTNKNVNLSKPLTNGTDLKSESRSENEDETCLILRNWRRQTKSQRSIEQSSNEEKTSEKDDNFVDKWVVGDLVWGRISGYPFWPCIVTEDPTEKKHTRTRVTGRVQRSVHVQFFGDKGKRSWIFSSAIAPFEGREAFANLAIKFSQEVTKNVKKGTSLAAFTISTKNKPKWDRSVEEAKEYLQLSRKERMKLFLLKYPIIESSDEEDNKAFRTSRESRKRKNEILIESTSVKKIKIESFNSPTKSSLISDQLITSTPIKQKKKSQNPTTNSSLPEQILINSKLMSEYLPSPKRVKQLKKRFGGAFNIYMSEKISSLLSTSKDYTRKDCELLTIKCWTQFTTAQKAEYKNKTIQDVTSVPEMELSTSEEQSIELSEESAIEELDEPAPLDEEPAQLDEEPAPLDEEPEERTQPNKRVSTRGEKKPGGIFKGKKQSRVCETCEQPDADVRCRGPCLSTHHFDCLDLESQNRYTLFLKSEANPNKKNNNKNDNVTSKSNMKPVKNNEEKENDENLNQKDKEIKEDEDEKSSSTSQSVNSKKKKKKTEINDNEYRCKHCFEGVSPPCFICNQIETSNGNSTRLKCFLRVCGKFYHQECVNKWPSWTRGQQTNGDRSKAICPSHVCHTCSNEDPHSRTTKLSNDRLIRCIRCPTAFHSGNYCIPAGTKVITNTYIICPKHYKPPKKGSHHVNTAWCFLCSMGGSLICCDLCPTSFHADCLKLPSPPEGSYICDDCEAGRFPLYGEIVWVKLGSYRWWPAKALFPNQVPDNVLNIPHQLGEFAVRFFGSHDYYWVSRGRCFLYQEGDSAYNKSKKTTVDGVFLRALAEANEAHNKFIEEKRSRIEDTRFGINPPKYVKIKSNKPVGNIKMAEGDTSTITPCECDPNSSNPCGPDSDCLNRILLVECNAETCPAGEQCGNQQFDKRTYPPLEPYRTESRGWGLKALKDLTKGEFVIEYVGEIIDEAEYRRRLERMHQEKDENYYFLTIEKDRMIDAGPKGNVARFMNHSCDPNCETQKWTVNGDTRVGLFALKDIIAGNELTFNYMLECSGVHKKPCMCGAYNCSGFIGEKVLKAEKGNKNGKNETDENGKKSKGISESDSKEKMLKKKKTKMLKNKSLQKSDTECFICAKPGELLLCDNKTCPKSYHLNCLRLKLWPDGKWLCPWHRCNKCNKRTSTRCSECPNAFCSKHAKSNIEYDQSTKFWLCTKHFKLKSKKVISNPVASANGEEEIKTEETAEIKGKILPNAGVSVIEAEPLIAQNISDLESDANPEEEAEKEDESFLKKVKEMTKKRPPNKKRKIISKKKKVKSVPKKRKQFPIKSRVRMISKNIPKSLLPVKILNPSPEDDTIENDIKIINSLQCTDLALVSGLHRDMAEILESKSKITS